MRDRICLMVLLSAAFLPGQIPDFRPPTPLFGAVLGNNAEAVSQLLAGGADPNEGRFFGWAPLHLAVVHGNRQIVRDLLAKGADAKVGDRHGSTALMWAAGAESPDMDLVNDLLGSGVDPNHQNTLGETALTWAVRRGNAKVVERLKQAGASDAAAVRRAVESAVALLQKSGPQFVKVSGCVSCHHQSLPQMAYAAARTRGYQVDPAMATQQRKIVAAMFQGIREGLEKGTVTLPNPGITVSYALLGLAAEGYAADETTAAMTKSILRTQQPDGSFAILPARPPLEASAFTAAALSIRALTVYGRDCEDNLARARAWLLEAKPVTHEDRTMRLLGLVWSKVGRPEIEKAAADLLARQRPDGGWAQLDDIESDAYATGEAMVALYEAGAADRASKALERGVAYLLRTQHADGSWLVRTRSSPVQPLKDSGFPHGRDQWISAAGTSWAAMALTLSQPPASAGLTARLR